MDKRSHKRKVMVLASCLACKSITQATREQVQHLRNEKKLNYEKAVLYLITGNSSPPMSQRQRSDETIKAYEAITQAKKFARELRSYDDAGFRLRLPALNAHYLPFPPGTQFKSTSAPKDKKVPIKVHLITLNAIRKQRGLKPLNSWRGTAKELLEQIDKQRRAHDQEVKESIVVPKHEAVVAFGAYRSDEEAFARTGHRVAGRTKSDEKAQQRKERFIDQRTPASPAPRTSSKHALKISEVKGGATLASAIKAKSTGPTFTLGDIADELEMDRKVARHKARRHAAQLQKFEVNKKYTYDSKSRGAVKAILQSDNRKR
jgi:hypothetical protein